jgi:hypothetical protein
MIGLILILLFVAMIILGLPQKKQGVTFDNTIEHLTFGPTITGDDLITTQPNQYENIIKHPDFNDYVLKSSLKPCDCSLDLPCMRNYMLKTECKPNTDLTKYMLKTECVPPPSDNIESLYNEPQVEPEPKSEPEPEPDPDDIDYNVDSYDPNTCDEECCDEEDCCDGIDNCESQCVKGQCIETFVNHNNYIKQFNNRTMKYALK